MTDPKPAPAAPPASAPKPRSTHLVALEGMSRGPHDWLHAGQIFRARDADDHAALLADGRAREANQRDLKIAGVAADTPPATTQGA